MLTSGERSALLVGGSQQEFAGRQQERQWWEWNECCGADADHRLGLSSRRKSWICVWWKAPEGPKQNKKERVPPPSPLPCRSAGDRSPTFLQGRQGSEEGRHRKTGSGMLEWTSHRPIGNPQPASRKNGGSLEPRAQETVSGWQQETCAGLPMSFFTGDEMV